MSEPAPSVSNSTQAAGQQEPAQVTPERQIVETRQVVAGGATMLIESFSDGSISVNGKTVTRYHQTEKSVDRPSPAKVGGVAVTGRDAVERPA